MDGCVCEVDRERRVCVELEGNNGDTWRTSCRSLGVALGVPVQVCGIAIEVGDCGTCIYSNTMRGSLGERRGKAREKERGNNACMR